MYLRQNPVKHRVRADTLAVVVLFTPLYKRPPSPSLQVRKRRLPGIDGAVEARDMDDWMVVDAGNVVVNVMDAGEQGWHSISIRDVCDLRR